MDIRYADHLEWTSPPPNLFTHPLVYPYHNLTGPMVFTDPLMSKGALADWLKLILLSNFLNVHALSSVVGYVWGALTRRFYTTVEFDEFDSTFCKRDSADLERTALILWIMLSLDQRVAGPATGVVHRSRHLHHNQIIRS